MCCGVCVCECVRVGKGTKTSEQSERELLLLLYRTDVLLNMLSSQTYLVRYCSTRRSCQTLLVNR
jgi:hypothetical protein